MAPTAEESKLSSNPKYNSKEEEIEMPNIPKITKDKDSDSSSDDESEDSKVLESEQEHEGDNFSSDKTPKNVVSKNEDDKPSLVDDDVAGIVSKPSASPKPEKLSHNSIALKASASVDDDDEDDSSSDDEEIDTLKDKLGNSVSEDDDLEEEMEIPKKAAISEDEDSSSSDEESENPKVPDSKAEGDNVSRDRKRETPNDEPLDDDIDVAGIVSGSPKPEKLSLENPTNNSSLALKVSGSGQKKIIWTEDIEVLLMKGMLALRKQDGFNPTTNWDASHDFVKKLLPFKNITKKQVRDKFWRIKKKYDDKAFMSEELYQLSKMMWGKDETGAKTGKRKLKSNGVRDLMEIGERISKKAKKEKPLNIVGEGAVLSAKVVRFGDKYPRLKEALDNENCGWFSKQGKMAIEIDLASQISEEKAKELEAKWKRVQTMEAELKLMRLDLVKEQTMMLVDLLKTY